MTAITPKANSVTHLSKLWVKPADVVNALIYSHSVNYTQIGFKCSSSTTESEAIR